MTSTFQSGDGAPAISRHLALALTGLLLACAALVFRVQSLDGVARFDEFYHLLAARGWLETGRPAILDGEYTRTRLFTAAVVEFFRLTGSESLIAGRVLAVAGGVLLTPIVFFWIHAHAGWTAGLIAAVLTILWPQGIEESQTLRFYTWHVLFVAIGAIAVFEAIEGSGRGWPVRAGWALAATFALLAALYLQISTAIVIAAIGLWAVLAHVLPWMLTLRRRWLVIALAATAGLTGVAAAYATGVLGALWQEYRWAPGWGERTRNQVTFYHALLKQYYPTFWPLFPFAALIAFRYRPRLAVYCLVLFGVILVAQSFGGMKAVRYLSYGMPFFFIVVALALTELGSLLREPLLAATRPIDPSGRGWVAVLAVAGATLFAASINPFFDRAIDVLRGRPFLSWPVHDWSGVPELVADWAEAPFRITTHELHTIVYLGDYDVLYNPSRLTELRLQEEFAEDPRTGRPVIAEARTVATILACHPEGLLLTETKQWHDDGWEATLMPVFEASGRRIEIRDTGALLALHWNGGAASVDACAALPG